MVIFLSALHALEGINFALEGYWDLRTFLNKLYVLAYIKTKITFFIPKANFCFIVIGKLFPTDKTIKTDILLSSPLFQPYLILQAVNITR